MTSFLLSPTAWVRSRPECADLDASRRYSRTAPKKYIHVTTILEVGGKTRPSKSIKPEYRSM
jgi:hypothetical protein